MKKKSLEEKLGYQFVNKKLLSEAITHKSFYIENNNKSSFYNERLEYLGDAVLDLAISDILFREFPNDEEGPLSHRRAALVSEEYLAKMALELELDSDLRLGKGERQLGGQKKNRLLSCVLEAVLGAIYIDAGFDAVKKVIEILFVEKIKNLGDEADYRRDYKTKLQEEIQKTVAKTPTYTVEVESGPPHDKTFEISVRLDARVLGRGQGKTKKQAEQAAALQALEGKTYES
jgi:ribonuclease-3